MAVYRAGKPEEELVTCTDSTGKVTEVTLSVFIRKKIWTIADIAMLRAGEPNTLRCMAAVKMFISADKPLPEDLKKWFIEGLDKHEERGGKKTLDEIYGYTRKEKKRNAYTEAKADSPYLVMLVSELKKIFIIDDAKAARLAVWREQSTLDPQSVTRKYRKHKEGSPPDNEHLYDQIDYREQDLSFLLTFTDAANRLCTGGVEKDLVEVQRAVDFISSNTSESYYDFIRGKKRIDGRP